MTKANLRLTGSQSYQLCKWLETESETIRNANLSKSEVKRRGQIALGFAISDSNLETACKTTGIVLTANYVAGNPVAWAHATIKRHDIAIRKLASELGVDLTSVLDSDA